MYSNIQSISSHHCGCCRNCEYTIMIMGILVMMIQIWWRNCCVIHYFTLYRAVKTDMAWVQQYELHMNDIVQFSWHVSWLFFQSRPFYSFYERARNRSSFLYILHESHPRIIEGYILNQQINLHPSLCTAMAITNHSKHTTDTKL